MAKKHVEVRCPHHKPHKIKGRLFETCGNLLGGIDITVNATYYYRCPTCGFWKIVVENEMVEYFRVPRHEKIEFDRHWRKVNE